METVSAILNTISKWIRRFYDWWLAQYRSREGRSRTVFVIVSLIIACCLCGMPLSIITPDPTPTPENETEITQGDSPNLDNQTEIEETTQDIPSPSPNPTNTMIPTDTAVPPTSAPQPTKTKVPTNTPLPTPEPTLIPTNTAIPSTPTPDPPNEEPALASDSSDGYPSGGLGLSKTDWERLHKETDLEFPPMGTGYDDKFDVMFQVNNVWHIEQIWSANNLATVEEVEQASQKLIPADSKYIGTYSPPGFPELIVNLYLSESLKSRFNNEDAFLGDWWTNGVPGNFIVVYAVFDGKVRSMIVGIGNNP